jgi:hypothetical protein
MQHHQLSSAYNVVVIALASTNSVTFSTSTPFLVNYEGVERFQGTGLEQSH